jgi:hypothetical protein
MILAVRSASHAVGAQAVHEVAGRRPPKVVVAQASAWTPRAFPGDQVNAVSSYLGAIHTMT